MFFDLRTQLSIKLIDDTHVFSSPPAPRLQPFSFVPAIGSRFCALTSRRNGAHTTIITPTQH